MTVLVQQLSPETVLCGGWPAVAVALRWVCEDHGIEPIGSLEALYAEPAIPSLEGLDLVPVVLLRFTPT